jgi:hypothetical protein
MDGPVIVNTTWHLISEMHLFVLHIKIVEAFELKTHLI